MTWEEFKEDNPFNLTERQYNRIRPYIEPQPHRLKKYEVGGPWSWVCNQCGARSRFGSKKRRHATSSANKHFRREHPKDVRDFKIVVVI